MPILDYESPRNRPPRLDPLFVTLAALITAPTLAFLFVDAAGAATVHDRLLGLATTLIVLSLCLGFLWWILRLAQR
jgi:hypothetical protein